MMAITLAKGQGLSLEKSQHNLSLVTIGLGWDIAEKKTGFLGGLFGSQSAEYDLDVVAFLCDADGKVRDLGWDGAGNATLRDSDVIFFNNLYHRSGNIRLTGDNRTGAGDGDDERILIDLQAIDSNIAKIAFVVTIHNAQAKRQTFGMINNSYVRLIDLDQNEKEICRFNLKENGSTATSVIFAELYRSGSEWQFKAVGEGKIADLNGVLALYQ